MLIPPPLSLLPISVKSVLLQFLYTPYKHYSPILYRWCLYLHQSSKAYDTLREGGIALPSQHTLRYYTYCCKVVTGFSNEVDQQLVLSSKVLTCEEWQKYVVLLVDEMYIRYMLT